MSFSLGSFTCPSFTASDTASDTQNFTTCDVGLCAGDSVTMGVCSDVGGSTDTDTYFIFVDSVGTVLSINDDYSGCSYSGGSEISYTVPDGSGCAMYTLRQGKYLLLLLSVFLVN